MDGFILQNLWQMMEKIAIYTCIIGGYDELQQPAVVEEGFDFICFVGPGERTAERVGVWEIRELAELPAGGPRMASRPIPTEIFSRSRSTAGTGSAARRGRHSGS